LLIKHEGRTYIANFFGTEGLNIELRGVHDMTQEVQSEATQFLDALYSVYEEENLSKTELEAVARAWGLSMREYTTWLEYKFAWEKDWGDTPHPDLEFEVYFICEKFTEMLYNRATLSTPEIMYATPEQLEEWKAFYLQDARERFDENCQLQMKYEKPWEHSTVWAENWMTIKRQAYYVFQIERRLG
jgi:hypothetical protein